MDLELKGQTDRARRRQEDGETGGQPERWRDGVRLMDTDEDRQMERKLGPSCETGTERLKDRTNDV